MKALNLFPVYLLHLCDGMNSGYPAIITPQLREDCSEFRITSDDESWIGSSVLHPFFSSSGFLMNFYDMYWNVPLEFSNRQLIGILKP